MTSELKPCPFCGGEARLVDRRKQCVVSPGVYEVPWMVECSNRRTCPALMLTTWPYATEEEAIEAWNTRAERTCRNVAKERGCWSVEFLCSECGHEAYHYDYKPAVGEHCLGCGAKVVE